MKKKNFASSLTIQHSEKLITTRVFFLLIIDSFILEQKQEELEIFDNRGEESKIDFGKLK